MTTPTKSIMDRDNDELAARKFADTVLAMIDDFIPTRCRREAWDRLAQKAYDQHFELTSWQMRKEYEAWKRTQLDILNMSPRTDGQSPRTEK